MNALLRAPYFRWFPFRANATGRALRIAQQLLALLLCSVLLTYAQGNTFNRVRYNGGTVPSKVSPHDWDNELIITSDMITLKLKDGAKVEISPRTVTSLSYGQEAHRRVGTMIALAVLVAPVALFGLLHKTRLHFIGIQYSTPEIHSSVENKKAGILLQGDKDNYRAILLALQGVTGVPVSVSEKDREFIPVGMTTAVLKENEEPKSTEQAAPPLARSAAGVPGTVAVTSVPDGADVYVDGSFVGNCPATLKLSAGKHSIRVSLSGRKDWSRDISVQEGSDVRLSANLESPANAVDGNNAGSESSPETGTVSVTSDPSGAEVYADGSLLGTTPGTFKLAAGQHYLRVFLKGYQNWSRQIAVEVGSEAHLPITLEKAN